LNIFETLSKQAQDIDLTLIELPKDEPKDNEKPLGIMSEDAMRLWELNNQLKSRMVALKKELKGLAENDDRYQELAPKLNELIIHQDAVSTLLSATINLEFPDTFNKNHVHVRKNGQICWRPCSCDNAPRGMVIEVVSIGPGGFSDLFSI